MAEHVTFTHRFVARPQTRRKMAVVPTLLAALLFAAAGYVSMLRGARIRLFPGAVVESGFGEQEMVLRNPVSETRLSYRRIRDYTANG